MRPMVNIIGDANGSSVNAFVGKKMFVSDRDGYYLRGSISTTLCVCVYLYATESISQNLRLPDKEWGRS